MTPERAARIAHDLKTPLAVIVGYADLMRTRDDEALRKEGLARILEAADTLSRRIDEAFQPAPAQPEPPDFSPETAEREPGAERKTVLVVDDDPLVRRLLRATLSEDEFEVVEAVDGADALARADALSPALVVLDWSMPGCSGGDVLAELQQRRPALPIVMLTAEPAARHRAFAEEHGAAAYLTKPFSPVQLVNVVERLLRPQVPVQQR